MKVTDPREMFPDEPRRRKNPKLPLFDSGDSTLSAKASEMFGEGEHPEEKHNQATVWLMIAGEAIAFSDDGEVVATDRFYYDGVPDWDYYAVCDDRGGGGRYGYFALVNALHSAEKNAELLGLEVKRVRT